MINRLTNRDKWGTCPSNGYQKNGTTEVWMSTADGKQMSAGYIRPKNVKQWVWGTESTKSTHSLIRLIPLINSAESLGPSLLVAFLMEHFCSAYRLGRIQGNHVNPLCGCLKGESTRWCLRCKAALFRSHWILWQWGRTTAGKPDCTTNPATQVTGA